jgi:cytochrome P450
MTRTLPQGPAGSLLMGCGDEFKKDPLDFFTHCQQQYGDFVPFRIGVFPCVLVSDPEMIHEVLVSRAEDFFKETGVKNNRAFFGDGLLNSEGEYWKRQRRLASPSFSPRALENYSLTMVDHTNALLKKWQDGAVVDIQAEMMSLTLSIAGRTLFDIELDVTQGTLQKDLIDSQHYLMERMDDFIAMIFPEWVPFPVNIHLLQSIKNVDEVIYKLIRERRTDTKGRTDLLSTLIDVRDDDGSGLTDRQIRDEVFTLFFAGHETTALTLTWTLHLLSQNPQVEERLLAELKEVIGDRRAVADDFHKLPYMDKVIRESMRVRPPVWAFGRQCIADCEIGGYPIPKGTTILMSQWVCNRKELYFKDPERFDPDRWTKEFSQNLPKFAYFPFGGGPRVCIGNNFAMLEGMLLLSSIMQDFHLTAVPDHPVVLQPAVTLKPKHGIKLKLTRRTPA